MGAWGAGSFENDDAMDWVDTLVEASTVEVLADSLKPALTPRSYLEAPEASVVVAAAEVVAAALGSPVGNLPADVTDWVATHAADFDGGIEADAIRAIDRVTSDSELRELWEESDTAEEWKAAVTDLRSRLLKPGSTEAPLIR
jgi:hypothetical protein